MHNTKRAEKINSKGNNVESKSVTFGDLKTTGKGERIEDFAILRGIETAENRCLIKFREDRRVLHRIKALLISWTPSS